MLWGYWHGQSISDEVGESSEFAPPAATSLSFARLFYSSCSATTAHLSKTGKSFVGRNWRHYRRKPILRVRRDAQRDTRRISATASSCSRVCMTVPVKKARSYLVRVHRAPMLQKVLRCWI